MQNNINNTPTFSGISRYLEREIYDLTRTQKYISKLSSSEFVGQLPPQIIRDIIKISKNPAEKKQNIYTVMNMLKDFAIKVNEPYHPQKNEQNFFQKFFAKFRRKDYLDKQLRVSHTEKQREELRNFLNSLSENITQTLKNIGLVKNFEKVKVEYLGKGHSGTAFRLIFPKRTGYQPKIIKVFNKSEFTRKQNGVNIFNLSTPFHEINSMLYVKNKHKKTGFKDSEYVEGYLASLKNKFILVEDTYNYPPKESNSSFKIDHDLYLMLWDKSTEGNVLNGRLVDYGYIQMMDKVPFLLKVIPQIRK